MTALTLSPRALCATEPITIALVVFVMLTAFLLLIIILLCVSKSFRAFFFREQQKPAARKGKQAAKKSAPIDGASDAAPPAPRAVKPKKASAPDDGVPTVPLNMPVPAPPQKRAHVRAVEATESEKSNTYTPRASTFARDKSQSVTVKPSAPATEKKVTRRAASVRSAQKDDKK